MNARLLTAIHESGHAIAAMSLGIIVTSVYVNDNATGMTHTRGPSQTVEDLERDLIVSFAGPFSEHFFAGTSLDCADFEGDRKNQARLTSKLAEHVGLFEADMRALACEHDAKRLVNRNRESIERLADKLLREGALHG